MRNSILLIILVFFSACQSSSSSSPSPIQKKELPSWVHALPPSDNEKYIYGIAIATDRKSAISAALSDMISKLGVNIESSFVSHDEVDGAYEKTTLDSIIKSKVSSIKINNYKVIKAVKINFRKFAVMVQTDKKKMTRGLLEDLKFQKNLITQKLDSIKNSNSIVKHNVKHELSKKAQDLLASVLMLHELDKNFDKDKNILFISQRKKDFLKELQKLKFYVSGAKNSEYFVKTIKNFLSSKNFNITTRKKGAVEIYVKVDTSKSKIASTKIAIIKLLISVKQKDEEIAGQTLTLKEIYNTSLKNVYAKAAIHLDEDMKSLGMKKTLGIDLK